MRSPDGRSPREPPIPATRAGFGAWAVTFGVRFRRLNGAGNPDAPHTLGAGHARVGPEAGARDSARIAAYVLAESQSRTPMPHFGTKGSQVRILSPRPSKGRGFADERSAGPRPPLIRRLCGAGSALASGSSSTRVPTVNRANSLDWSATESATPWLKIHGVRGLSPPTTSAAYLGQGDGAAAQRAKWYRRRSAGVPGATASHEAADERENAGRRCTMTAWPSVPAARSAGPIDAAREMLTT